MINGVVITMLAVETVSDIRTRKISLLRLSAFLAAGIVFNIVMKYQTLWSLLGGIAPGLILMLYARLTGEGIGYGDCVLFIVSGIFIGFFDNLKLLFLSLVLASVVGGVLVLLKKGNFRMKIPFVPCILSAYAIMIVLENVL